MRIRVLQVAVALFIILTIFLLAACGGSTACAQYSPPPITSPSNPANPLNPANPANPSNPANPLNPLNPASPNYVGNDDGC